MTAFEETTKLRAEAINLRTTLTRYMVVRNEITLSTGSRPTFMNYQCLECRQATDADDAGCLVHLPSCVLYDSVMTGVHHAVKRNLTTLASMPAVDPKVLDQIVASAVQAVRGWLTHQYLKVSVVDKQLLLDRLE